MRIISCLLKPGSFYFLPGGGSARAGLAGSYSGASGLA